MGCGDTVRSPAVSLFFPIYSYLSWYGNGEEQGNQPVSFLTLRSIVPSLLPAYRCRFSLESFVCRFSLESFVCWLSLMAAPVVALVCGATPLPSVSVGFYAGRL